MSKKKLVFISTPMTDKSEEEILKDIEKAEELYLKKMGNSTEDICFLNNLEEGKRALEFEKKDADKEIYDDKGNLVVKQYFIEPKHMPIWYLGIALCNLAYCDEAVFYPSNWVHSRGCLIEHEVCCKYGIPQHLTDLEGSVILDGHQD